MAKKQRFWTSSEIAVLFKLYSLFKFKPSHHSRNGSMCRGGNEHFLALSHWADCNEYRLWFCKGPFFLQSTQLCKLRVTNLSTPFELVIVCCWGGNSRVAKRHSSAASFKCTGTEMPALLFHKACSWKPKVSLASKLCRLSWAFPPDLHGRALRLVDLYSCLLIQSILCFWPWVNYLWYWKPGILESSISRKSQWNWQCGAAMSVKVVESEWNQICFLFLCLTGIVPILEGY